MATGVLILSFLSGLYVLKCSGQIPGQGRVKLEFILYVTINVKCKKNPRYHIYCFGDSKGKSFIINCEGSVHGSWLGLMNMSF